jgi:hypothetical protein
LSGKKRAEKEIGEIQPSNEVKEVAEFLEQISGGLISNALGLVNDRLEYLRFRQALSLRDKVADELARRGVKQPKKVAPKFLAPVLEAATLEDDDNIHTRYATMLANARDPNYSGEMIRSFVSILDDMESIDVLILDVSHDGLVHLPDHRLVILDQLVKVLKVPRKAAAISVRNLIRLGLLKPGVVVAEGVRAGQHPLTSYKDIEQYGITELGIAFVAATRPRPAAADKESAA